MKGANFETQFPEARCLHQHLELFAKNQPKAVALVFQDQHLTYQELDALSSILANYLQKSGVQKGDFVAICLDRSINLIVGIFGILKAGAAYLPIDADYPAERLNFMIEDAGVKMILSETKLKNKLPAKTKQVLCLDEDWTSIENQSDNTYKDISSPEDLAYLIYTSGSTGQPKGVMVPHKNVMNHLESQQAFAKNPVDRILLSNSISFDASVILVFWSLMQGATLVIPEQGAEKDIRKLADEIHRSAVTHIITLPSLYTLLLDQGNAQSLASLQFICVAGEACPPSLVQKHYQLIPQAQLYNLYGPTEATIGTTYFPVPKDFDQAKIPIGKAMLNYEVFLLNDQLEEVETGETGEIYIGGSKQILAKGYWNRPELTKERFIDNPFKAERGGERLYKTGDLATYLPDGNIDFIGRADLQVKYKGYRIELGEIEAAIAQHTSVQQTVVALKNQDKINQQKLVAYLVLGKNKTLNYSELRTYLEKQLPAYMLPSHVVFLDQMPLTANSKIDRNALPEPSNKRPELAQAYKVAKTDLEAYLVDVWEDLLQLSPIGINDKFFELGGTSIQAAQFIGGLQKKLKTNIFVTTIFDCPTIAEYAAMLEKEYEEEVKPLLNRKVEAASTEKSKKLDLDKINSFKKFIPTLSSRIPATDKKSEKNESAIFILAPPRSGTSLLRTMLAGHPGLFAANELQLLGFHTLKARSKAYSGKFKLWQEGLIRTIMELKTCDAAEARKTIKIFEDKNYSTKALYKEIQSWIGNQVLVDKSPSYALDLGALEKAERDFENAIYIHLVRHPYAMISSFEKKRMDQVQYLKTHPFSSRELGELIWWYSHKNVSTFLKDIPASRQFRVIYEDLVTDPEKTIRALCSQVGIEFHEGLLTPYKDLDKKMVDGIYKDSAPMSDVNFFQHQGINPKMANISEKVKTDNFLSENTWELAQSYGYQLPGETTTSTSKKEEAIQSNDIAIIGMSVRVPGADTLHEFWLNLVNGTDVGQEATAEDLSRAGLDPKLLEDPNYVKRFYSLSHPECFDAKFFGFHPKEAKLMDPQHRVFLETSYAALESTGYNPSEYDGKIGVYGSIARNSYFTDNLATYPELLKSAGDYQDALGNEKSFSISRVAYKLDLKGPAVNVQTACSSSGIAVHLACKALLNEDADMVLTGGGRIQTILNSGYKYFDGGPLSPDGYIRAFDADAKGMVRSNGMAVIVLKKLDKAIKDGDHIWAVIKGTAINNDGSDKIGFTAPSIKGQANAIIDAHKNANISAESIDYIEAHGTGTTLGDPIEIGGLNKAFEASTSKKQFCAIGSVKTNIGHLDAGACVAGIIKTALAMQYELLPPSLNFKKPNTQIDFENTPFYVNDKLNRWSKGEKIRRAGVSSFGLGGTNAHVILEEAPEIEEVSSNNSNNLLVLSAKTKGALFQSAHNLAELLERKPGLCLDNVAYTLALGRKHYGFRKTITASNHEEALSGLRKDKSQQLKSNAPSTIFLFSGGGAQYVNMGRDLYLENPVFKKYVDECIAILEARENLSIKELIYPGEEGDLANQQKQIEKPCNALATLFTIEYALAKTWIEWGVEPTEMIGHSMGEYTVACIAGVFSLEEALSLVVLRGRLFESLPTEGGMLSLPLAPKEAEAYLNEELTISVINRPNSCVVSGTAEAISQLEQKLLGENIEAKRIHITVAAHSPQVDPILDEFRAFLDKISFKTPKIPFISNVSGTWAIPEEVCTPDYWIKHIRQTVRFSDGLATLFELENRILLEVGPGQTLSSFARQHPDKNSQQLILASTRHPKEKIHDLKFILKTVGQLWTAGQNINWVNFHAHQTARRVPMPTYPFERKRHWIEPNTQQVAVTPAPIINRTEEQTIAMEAPKIEAIVETSKPKKVIPRKQRISSIIKEALFELSGLEPEEMDGEATFLELGFDSLFLTQAITELNQTFNLNITFRQLFEEAPNIDALAEYIDHHLPEGVFDDSEEVAESPVASLSDSIVNTSLVQGTPIQTHTAMQIPRKEKITVKIKEVLFELSGLAPEEMDEEATFLELGFDSLFLTQATTEFNQFFGLNITFRQLFEEAPNIDALADYIDHHLPEGVFDDPVSATVPPVQQHALNTNLLESLSNLPANADIGSAIASALTGTISQIVQEQLQQALGQKSISPVKKISPSIKAAPVVTNKEETDDKKGKAFGPWKPVSSKVDNSLSETQKKNLKDFLERFNEKTKGSKALTASQRKHLADPRAIQAFNKLWKEAIYQIAMKGSKGSKLYDIDGNEYIDFLMSFGIGLMGHAPDFIQEAVKAQVDKGMELSVQTPLAKDVADLICELSGMERACLVNTGSEAVSASIRIARTVTGKNKIAVFEGDYHGIADEMLVRGIKVRGKTKSMPIAPGIPKFLVENVIVLYKDDPNVLDVIRENANELAGIIFEPIQTQMPHLQHRELIHQVRAITKELNIAMIFDELVTGFRYHIRGAQGWYGVDVDICAYGKVCSGGMPMAAVAGKARFLDAFDGGQWQYGDDSFPEAPVTFFGGTFVKHPVSLAASKALLTKLKEEGPQLQVNLNKKTAKFAEQLKELFLETKAPLAIKSTASIVSVKTMGNGPLYKLFFHVLRYHGVYMTERAGILSTEHTEEDLAKVLDIFRTSIQEMFDWEFFQEWDGEDDNEIVYPPYLEEPSVEVLKEGIKKIPLTDGQEEIWISQQFSNEAASAYNLSSELRLVGDFQLDKMNNAIQKLVDRHESLRTVFDRTTAFQLISATRKADIPFLDLSNKSQAEKDQALADIHQEEAETVLDLYEGPLCRFKIVKLEADVHLVFITVHHIISDGWSLGIIISDLGELYATEIGAPAKELKPPKQLSEFALEEASNKSTQAYKNSEQYWVNQFKDSVPVLEFPTDRSRPPIKTFNSSMEKIVLSKEVYNDMRKTAAKQGSTFYVFMYAAFQAFIHRLSQQDDFVLGVVAAGQSIAGNADLVGHSVSLLPVRMQIDSEASFTDHLKKSRATILDAFDHQNYTLGALVKKLKLPRDLSRQPIVSILFNLDNEFSTLNYGGLNYSSRAVPRKYETFDIFINIKLLESGVAFEWIYNMDLFNQDTIQRRLKEFETLLLGIIAQPDQALSKLPLLPKEEKQQLLSEWNKTKANYPLDKTIQELVEQQVAKTPDRPALQFKDHVLSYDELNKKANQVAHYMKQEGVQKGDYVGIYLERSAEMVISLFAAFKLGAIYIPLDPVNPTDRLELILEDVKAKYLLTHQLLKNRMPSFDGKVICLDHSKKEIEQSSAKNLNTNISAKDLAYIIYTSGSTGKPKGVSIPHYTVVDHHMAIIDKLNITKNDVIFAVASIAFDPSVQDFFLPLFLGAKTIVASQETLTDGFLLKARLESTQPTLMQATPSTWRMLLMAGWEGSQQLRILSGGEGLTKDLAHELVQKSKELWNIYGPTETTIWSTAKKLEGDRLKTVGETSYEPVGSPINNVQIYILDKHLQPVPIGVGGEIFIGGIGVAPTGYFNRPELTEKTFIPNPFQSNGVDSKLYRTGDLARYLSNGDIEYLSRGDKQVKIRGFRIELGEIESAIASYPDVRENTLMVREDQPDNKQLVAYLIPKKGKTIDSLALKLFLKEKLPEYMVPVAFVEMESFPMTASMKIDRKRLPVPEIKAQLETSSYEAPTTDTEKTLTKIWSKLLGIKDIGINDNFFELGGHSLIAVNMMTKIDKAIGKKLPLAVLLENSTIKSLARLLDQQEGSIEVRSLVPVKTTGSKTPIYLVHGAGLHVLLFQTLAKLLHEEQPIYALQARGLHGEAEPLDSIEAIASHYIGEIIDQNPMGPYCLAGYSYGGIIALEMAKQLQAMGKEVKLLAMLDTVIRGPITGEVKNPSFGNRVKKVSKKVAWNIKDTLTHPASSFKYRSFILKRAYKRWMNGGNGNGEHDQDNKKDNYAALVDQTNFKAINSYRIKPYNGTIHLFRAAERRFYMSDKVYLGWKPYVNREIVIHDIPGDHLTMFNGPNGKTFAEILQKCMDEVLEQNSQQIEA